MELRTCGKSDLILSVLGTGCWAFGGGDYWGHQEQKDVTEVVRRSVELGINYFDTAEAYNDGRSEQSLGLALESIPRHKVIIGTKISPSNAYPEVLIRHCEASLKRLRTDYIDLYMIHWPIHPHSIRHFTDDLAVIENPPLTSAALETMTRLKEQGKIRFIGVSNYGVARLREAQYFNQPIIVNELPYNLLARAIEWDILPYCKESGIGIIGYMTLLQGLLADIYRKLSDVPLQQRRTRHFDSQKNSLCRHAEDGAEQETENALAQIRLLSQECGLQMPELAIQWAMHQKAITSVLVGARNRRELEANVMAASKPMNPEMYEKLNAATLPLLIKLGKSFDYYESTVNNRTQ
jgi:myo-inositol catabolism protein IolS